MAAELLTDASRATDANGEPYSGAIWRFYETGTLTPQAVYADASLAVSLGYAVTADAGGKFVPIYFDAEKAYRGILKDATGAVTIYDIDPINATSEMVFDTWSPTAVYDRGTIGDKLQQTVYLDDFGAVGDGVADDSDALADACAVLPKGGIIRGRAGRYYYFAAPIDLPQGIRLIGENTPFVDVNGRFDTLANAASAIVLDANQIKQGRGAEVSNWVIWKKGLVAATSEATALTKVAAFAGIALEFIDRDAKAYFNQIIGFDTGIISAGRERPEIYGNAIDCTNGIDISGVFDCGNVGVSYNRCYPYFTVNQTWTTDDTLRRDGVGVYVHDTADGLPVQQNFTFGCTTGLWLHDLNFARVSHVADNVGGAEAAGTIGIRTTGAMNMVLLDESHVDSHDNNYSFEHTSGLLQCGSNTSGSAVTRQIHLGASGSGDFGSFVARGTTVQVVGVDTGCGTWIGKLLTDAVASSGYGVSIANPSDISKLRIDVNFLPGSTLINPLDPVVNLRKYGAVGDATVDDTVAIQAAVTVAAMSGAAVFAPAGKYRTTAPIVVATPVNIYGVGANIDTTPGGNTHGASTGAWFYLNHSGVGFYCRDDASVGQAKSFARFEGFGTYRNHSAPSLTPATAWTPTTYGEDFRVEFRVQVDDIVTLNPYIGFRVRSAGVLWVGRLRGQPLYTGIEVERSSDVQNWDSVHFWPFWSVNSNVIDYTLDNAVAVRVRRADGLTIKSIFSYGYHRTILAQDVTADGGGFGSFSIGRIYADKSGGTVEINSDFYQAHGSIASITANSDLSVGGTGSAVYLGGDVASVLDIAGMEVTRSHEHAVKTEGAAHYVNVSAYKVADWNRLNSSYAAWRAADGATINLMADPAYSGVVGLLYDETGGGIIKKITLTDAI